MSMRQALIQGLSATPEKIKATDTFDEKPLTSDEIVQEAQFAWKTFQQEYSDLLACFDAEKLLQTVADEGHLVGPTEGIVKSNYDFKEIVAFIERNFIALLDRGALDSLQRFGLSKSAQGQLTAMEAKARVAAPSLAPTFVSASPVVSELDQCVSDFNAMPAAQFRAKWMGAKRHIYEQAFQEGRV